MRLRINVKLFTWDLIPVGHVDPFWVSGHFTFLCFFVEWAR